MLEKLLPVFLGAVFPVLFGGIAMLISMRVEIAVMKEKTKYQSGQIRSLLRRLNMVRDESTGEIDRTD